MKKLLLLSCLFLLFSCSKDASTPELAIGQEYKGGLIFYLDASRQHGLIASHYTFEAKWGCENTLLQGANSTGTGNQNTIDIVNGCSEVGIAAKLCSDLVTGGYSDWYLPSCNELYLLYMNRFSVLNIGGMTSSNHWSSTQVFAGDANCIYFGGSNVLINSAHKFYTYSVNPIRIF